MARSSQKAVGVRLSVDGGTAAKRTLDQFGESGKRAFKVIEGGAARATPALRALDAASRGVQDHLQGMASRAGVAGEALSGMGKKGALLAAGLGGIIALVGGAVGSGLRELAREIAAVGDEAKRAGVDIEAFQELKYVAEQNRIGVDALTDGLKEMNLRADEFVITGGGSSAEAFKRLGYDAETLAKKLKDPSALFTEILGKLEKFDSAAQIRISDEIFGGSGGEQFVQLLDQGAESVQRTIDKSHELGIVINEELITKAEELDKAFADIADTVTKRLQQNIIYVGWALYDFMLQFAEFEDRSTTSLEERMRSIGIERLGLENSILKLQGASKGLSEPDGGVLQRSVSASIDEIKAKIASLSDEELEILHILTGRGPKKPGELRTTDNDGDSGGGGSKKVDPEARRLERIARTWITKVTPALDAHLKMLADLEDARERGFLTEMQHQDAAAAAQRSFNELLDEERIKRLEASDSLTDGLALGMEQWLESAETTASRVADTVVRSMGRAEDAFVEFVTTGKGSFSDLAESVLADVTRMFARQGVSALFGGLGGSGSGGGGFDIGGFITSLFEPRARGGPVNAGQTYLVGEHGEELFTPNTSGTISPNGSFGGGSGMSFSPTTYIDARGSDVSEARIRELLDARDRKLRDQFPGMVRSVVSDPRRDYV